MLAAIGVGSTRATRTLVPTGVSGAGLLRRARRHRVLPLVGRALLESGICELLSDGLADRLHAELRKIAIRNLFLSAQLVELLAGLRASGIRAIPFKGPVLAHVAYTDLSRRQFGDLDLLVDPADFERACSALKRLGFEVAYELEWESSLARGPVVVDLHRTLTQSSFPVECSFGQLWERRKPTCIAGTTVPTACVNDTLVILCVQLAKDAWENHLVLVKACDIAQTISTRACDVDWRWLAAECRRLGIQRMLYLGLLLVHLLFETPVPMELLAAAESDGPARRFAGYLCRRLWAGHYLDDLPFPTRLALFMGLRERRRDKIRQLRILPEKAIEWSTKSSSPRRSVTPRRAPS